MCRLPVTLGGGIMMVKGGLDSSNFAEKASAASQREYCRSSTSSGRSVLSSIAGGPLELSVLVERASARPRRGLAEESRPRHRAGRWPPGHANRRHQSAASALAGTHRYAANPQTH